jgi:AcrR family transcriptional regulator
MPEPTRTTNRSRATDGSKRRAVDSGAAPLDAACRPRARKGLRGLRVEEVAGDVGVAASLIYHFRDRATLRRAALEHVGRKAYTYTDTDEHASGRQEPTATLVAEIRHDTEIRENSGAWGELRDTAIFDQALRPTLFEYAQEWIADIATLVRRGQGEGSIPRGLDCKGIGQRLTALTEGLGTRWLSGFVATEAARDELQRGIERCLEPAPFDPIRD